MNKKIKRNLLDKDKFNFMTGDFLNKIIIPRQITSTLTLFDIKLDSGDVLNSTEIEAAIG